ncbi:hypothetical protein [Amycolatopsis sp. WAC 01416]|uniref:hypothetical protein n=1 Tax=Amycolatopsis sp. WAC 01416 TaxID=2203196 RepID=UPI000F79E954|nr:hypothetical protein [Amycolatopsis sp. WAC 01416]
MPVTPHWADGYESNPYGNNGLLFACHGCSTMRIAESFSSFPSNRSNCSTAIYADPVNGGATVGLDDAEIRCSY